MSPPLRRRSWSRGGQVLVAVTIVAILSVAVDWGKMLQLFRNISIPLFGVCIFWKVLDTILLGVKWNWLLQAFDAGLPYRTVVSIYFQGGIFKFLIPSTLGIDAYKTYRVKRQGRRLTSILASIFLERFLGAYSSIMFLSMFISIYFNLLGFPYATAFGIIGWIFFFGSWPLLIYALRNSKNLIHVEEIQWLPAKIGSTLARILRSAPPLAGQIPRGMAYFGASIVEKAFYGTSIYFAARAVGIQHVGYLEILATVSFLALLEKLPISIAAIGLREGLIVGLFHLLGIDATRAVMASLVLRGVEICNIGIGAIIWVLARRKGDKNIELKMVKREMDLMQGDEIEVIQEQG